MRHADCTAGVPPKNTLSERREEAARHVNVHLAMLSQSTHTQRRPPPARRDPQAPAGGAQGAEQQAANQEVAGLILGQGTGLGCGPGPQ